MELADIIKERKLALENLIEMYKRELVALAPSSVGEIIEATVRLRDTEYELNRLEGKPGLPKFSYEEIKRMKREAYARLKEELETEIMSTPMLSVDLRKNIEKRIAHIEYRINEIK